jgi:hypothetical protein
MTQIASKQRPDDIALEHAKESLKLEHACHENQQLNKHAVLYVYSDPIKWACFAPERSEPTSSRPTPLSM